MKSFLLTHRGLRWAIGCLGLWLLSVTWAQAIVPPYLVSVTHLTTEQGLPSRTVLCFGQDREGFVWIGTFNGAYRFDGSTFTAAHLPTSKESAYNPGFSGFGTDHAGNFWFHGGLVASHREQYVIRPGQTQPVPVFSAFPHARWLKKDPMVECTSGVNHTFQYFRTKSGKIWYQNHQGKVRAIFQHPDLITGWDMVGRLFETRRHTLLVSLVSKTTNTPGALIELDSVGHLLKRYPLWPNNTFIPFWEATDGSIYLYPVFYGADITTGKVTNPRQFLYKLSADKRITPISLGLPPEVLLADTYIQYDELHGLFWITGSQMLIAWHPTQGIVFDLAKSGFPINRTERLIQTFIDRSGAVWVAMVNGMLILTLEPNQFRRYLHVDEDQPAASRQPIRAMTQLGNRLWVNGPTTQLVDLTTGASQPAVSHNDVHPAYTQNLTPLVQTRDGVIWSMANSVLRYDPKTTSASSFSLTENNSSISAWPDNRGRIWVGHLHGLSAFDTETHKPYPFTRYNQFTELAQQRITGFFSDRPQKVAVPWCWLTSSSGLYQFDPVRGIIGRYSTLDKAPRHLPVDNLSFIYPDPEQTDVYWLATLGGGLIRWNRADGTCQQFTTKEGLSDNTLYAIYADRHGRLWLPSNYGLMSFHRKTHQIQIYHTKSGITDEEFNLMAHYRAPDGRLFFGGLNGITAFYPDQILPEKRTEAPLLVSKYQKLDTEKGQLTDHLADFEQTKQVHLTASDRLFNLSFALLDYRQLGRFRLWYRIEGWQEHWVMQQQPELRINGLPAGEYTLEVQAQTVNGDWGSAVVRIPVVVDKPIYLRTWFLLGCLLVLGWVVVAAFRWRNRQLVRETMRLEDEVARRTAQIEQQATELQANATLKSRFFANVTHEFRTPLTLLLGPLQYLSQRITEGSARQLLTAMERNALQLLTLVNDLLDLSRLDTQQLQLTEQPADASQLIQQLTLAFMPQTQYAGVHLDVAGIDDPCPMSLDAQKLETVLRNLLANALHHTSAGGWIRITLSRLSEQAVITVSDTGSGIHPDDLPHIFDRYFQSNQTDKQLRGGTGIGLALCHEYCQLWGGSIRVSSQLGKGSTFTVNYPVRAFIQETVCPLPLSTISPITNQYSLPESPEADTKSLKPATDISILVVEDNVDMLLYIQTILAPLYTLRLAHDGQKALELLRGLSTAELPNLIMSDIMMPELDGLGLAKALRMNEKWRHIPIILLTARTDLDSRLEALRMGVADYLTKPFYEPELIARIQNLLHRVGEQQVWRQESGEKGLLVEKGADEWMAWLQETIRHRLNDPFFNIKTLADLANLSERQLNRRVKALTGLSPSLYIQEMRLQVAYDLFEKQPDALVKTIAYQVGYQKTSYFSQVYRERFGIDPETKNRSLRACFEVSS